MLINRGKLFDHINIQHIYDADGTHDGTTPKMVDMQGVDGCLVVVFPTVSQPDGTDHLTGFKIVSNSAQDGSGTDTDIAEAVTTDGGTTQTLDTNDIGTGTATTALNGNFYVLDIRADQMADDDRYIGAVTAKTGTLEITIMYMTYNLNHAFRDVGQATRLAFQHDGNL